MPKIESTFLALLAALGLVLAGTLSQEPAQAQDDTARQGDVVPEASADEDPDRQGGPIDEDSLDPEVDDSDLDDQTYESDDDIFVPSEEIPADEPIPFPSDI